MYISLLLVAVFGLAWFLYEYFTREYDPFDVDIRNVQISISFEDVQDTLKAAIQIDNQNKLLQVRQEIVSKDSELFDFWLLSSLGIDYDKDSIYRMRIRDLLKDPYTLQMDSLEESNFDISNSWKNSVTDGFKRLKVHSEKISPPSTIYFINSWYGINAIYTNQPVTLPIGVVVLKKEGALVVQKEKYLGSKVALINLQPEGLPPINQFLHTWITEKYQFRFLQRDIFEQWLETTVFFPNNSENEVVHELIRYGKILYFTHAAIPEIDLPSLFRYSSEEYEWAANREKMIWRYLIENELIFDAKDQTKYNLFYEGPFTQGLNEQEGENQSPDRIGKFIGYRMVKSFMDKNASENYGLQQLMEEPVESFYKNYKPE